MTDFYVLEVLNDDTRDGSPHVHAFHTFLYEINALQKGVEYAEEIVNDDDEAFAMCQKLQDTNRMTWQDADFITWNIIVYKGAPEDA